MNYAFLQASSASLIEKTSNTNDVNAPTDATPSQNTPTLTPSKRGHMITPTNATLTSDSVLPPTTPAKSGILKATSPNKNTPKPSVGFSPSNMVMEAASDQEDPEVIQVRPQLAPVFTKTSKRKTTLFIKIRLPVKAKPKDPTAATHLKLKELGELMINVDPTTLIYKYKQTAKDENDACTKLSQLPTTITGVQSFMNGFRPSPAGGDLWGNLRIGIDSNAEELLSNVSQEAFMRQFWIRKAPLQVAE
jgi:hypothetical protein